MKTPLLFLLLASASLLPAQTLPEKLNVNVVLVDARVTDARGNQILGLGKDDFVISEDGRPQTIESVDYFTNRRLLSSNSNAAFSAETMREQRDIILFIDRQQIRDTGQSGSHILQLRQAMDRFIDKQLKPGDRVAIAGYSGRLTLFSDFTSDRAALRRAASEAITFSRGITKKGSTGDESILSNLDMRKMIDRTGRVEDAVTLLADAVQPIPRRKIMVFFSEGMEYEPTYLDPMLRALGRANITVYAVNLLREDRVTEAEHALSRMTSSTGGDYFPDSVDFFAPLREIEKANNGYYVLSYSTHRDPDHHGYQRIDVKLRNPEFRVHARPGYAY